MPREYLTLDDTALNAIVRATKGTKKIPGIAIYSVDVPVQRRT